MVEGVSGAGKTSVCRELQQRGYHAVNGDTELAYHESRRGTDVPLRWLSELATFIDLFDGVFVLDVDVDHVERAA